MREKNQLGSANTKIDVWKERILSKKYVSINIYTVDTERWFGRVFGGCETGQFWQCPYSRWDWFLIWNANFNIQNRLRNAKLAIWINFLIINSFGCTSWFDITNRFIFHHNIYSWICIDFFFLWFCSENPCSDGINDFILFCGRLRYARAKFESNLVTSNVYTHSNGKIVWKEFLYLVATIQ